MAQLTTDRAMRMLLIGEEHLLTWLRAGYTKAQRSNYLRRLDNDQLSQQKREEILTRCGFTVKQEKTWNKPKKL